jgi:hypothetical protein
MRYPIEETAANMNGLSRRLSAVSVSEALRAYVWTR